MEEFQNELKKVPVTAALILLNLAVFLATDFTGGSENTAHMIQWGASYTPLILEEGEWYRLFTAMFLHFGITHLGNNMLVLFVLGQRLEPAIGKARFLAIYLLAGLGGNLISLGREIQGKDFAVSAGASGAVFGIMGAMLYVLLLCKGRLSDLTARQVLIMAAFSLYFGFTSGGVDNAAHVGGLLCGFLAALLLVRRPSLSRQGP
ncbi:MAG: rhomboid family intramembrane serine protease [Eubacteriales bacterium]|nr:rhomboid family intramembrane serine protease [Eubacteriales bacterium]